MFQICAGMSVAINVRVGNELGAGNPLSAKRASYVAIIMQSEFPLANKVPHYHDYHSYCRHWCRCDGLCSKKLHRKDFYI